MGPAVCIYLPVKDLDNARSFYSRVGFQFDTHMSDKNVLCMTLGGETSVILVPDKGFEAFTKKTVTDTLTHSEAVIAITVLSKEKVDEIVLNAFEAGGKSSNEKIDDGKRYVWSFQDPDGHLWEIIYRHSSKDSA